MKLALFFFATFWFTLFSFGQKNSSPALEARLIRGISALIENNQTVSLAELNNQLKQAVGRKAKIPKVASFVYDPQSLYQLCRPSTLIVARLYKCEHCTNWHSGSATGFPLTKDGVFATQVLAADKDSDVAIVRAKGAKFRPLPLGEPAKIGSNVHVISHPDGMFYYYSKGMVSLYDTMKGKPRTQWMAISADYARGSSGAPVLNDSGEVVGMVASTVTIHYEKRKMTNPQMVVRLCAPVDAIRDLIE
jgi:serine protease Do